MPWSVRLLALCASLAPAIAGAQRPPDGLPGTWRVGAGGVTADAAAVIRFDAADGRLGSRIDVEDDLGFGATARSAFATVTWEPNWVHRVALSYYDVDRSSTRRLRRPITWAGTTYNLNAQVAAGLRTRFITLTYQWSAWRNARVQLGPSIAIPVLTADASIAGRIEVTTGPDSGRIAARREATSVTVPVPLPGLHLSARIRNDLYLDSRVQYLAIEAFDVAGGASDIHAQLVYFPRRWIAIGAGYLRNAIRLEGEDPRRINGYVKYAFDAVALQVNLAR